MPIYHYRCERCKDVIPVEMTVDEKERINQLRAERGVGDYIHHDDCKQVGVADILPQAHRTYQDRNKKATPVLYKSEGFTKTHDIK